jgi:hypothetical protein
LHNRTPAGRRFARYTVARDFAGWPKFAEGSRRLEVLEQATFVIADGLISGIKDPRKLGLLSGARFILNELQAAARLVIQ